MKHTVITRDAWGVMMRMRRLPWSEPFRRRRDALR